MAIELSREELGSLIAMAAYHSAIEQVLTEEIFNSVLKDVKEKTGAIPFSSKAEAQFYHRNLVDKLTFMYRNAR